MRFAALLLLLNVAGCRTIQAPVIDRSNRAGAGEPTTAIVPPPVPYWSPRCNYDVNDMYPNLERLELYQRGGYVTLRATFAKPPREISHDTWVGQFSVMPWPTDGRGVTVFAGVHKNLVTLDDGPTVALTVRAKGGQLTVTESPAIVLQAGREVQATFRADAMEFDPGWIAFGAHAYPRCDPSPAQCDRASSWQRVIVTER